MLAVQSAKELESLTDNFLFQAYHFGKNYFELGVGGEGQDTSRNIESSFGPYVQYCPCEASGQKLGQKTKSELKEIELSYCHHSICL